MSTAILCGLIILITLIIMLIAGVPIAVALGVSSVCAILPIMDFDVAVLTGAQRIFSGISVFSLLAIPFFILAGNIMNKGGIAIRIINLAKVITGRTPGALAQTNVLANMLFGAISGSGTAAASAMGSIIGPIEKEEGYDPSFSAAVNVATAPTGLLIPPSNVMITFSLVSGAHRLQHCSWQATSQAFCGVSLVWQWYTSWQKSAAIAAPQSTRLLRHLRFFFRRSRACC